ncbi:hypothetical protein [Campylobacter porcelli]|uniref:Type II secretion system protein n=2 Tax=Campylobacteraceae TaxID=72294 RepID=A0A1X9SWH3_9BACT|nr:MULTISPECIES: hypothetical protein [unclassified Campylobacter]ARR00634.1 hypothetical protein CSUIS_0819 [Campylobacter sp. RM6137]MEE3704173.1 hypothetical protein [Campylobacter sp. CX2-8023-23]MEE3743820.1 hypothetical protein [Campylobacter sp. CX2-4855-23]MEE3776079.1 hypothetical protein [Campylobacter sp. CX2-4080-23]
MRYAFSSIELVISIIIVSIGVYSIPSIIQISHKSASDMILSQAISQSYTKMLNIISHPWSDSIDPALPQPIYHSDTLPLNSLTSRQISQISPNNINNNKNSINGFDGDSGVLKASSKSLLNLDYLIKVKFVDKPNGISSSDAMQISISTKANDQLIILNSYSYNIGEPLIKSLIIPAKEQP